MLPQPASMRVERGSMPATAGIGLRFQHHQEIVATLPNIGWLEVHTENYMGGGPTLQYLDDIRRDYPISLHGVGLSLGSADGLDCRHVQRIQEVIDRVDPELVSEHLSWSVFDGHYLADLLPLPMTEEALAVVCMNINEIQTQLGRQILIENPSSYLRYKHSTIPEWEFIAALAKRTGCGILCDVNNIYVSCWNHGWDAATYLSALPADAIGEIHLAGHTVRPLDNDKVIRIDDHASRVSSEVWALYKNALSRFGPIPTLIEWDTDVPALEVLLEEARLAQALLDHAEGKAAYA